MANETTKPLRPVPERAERGIGCYGKLEWLYRVEEKPARVLEIVMSLFTIMLGFLVVFQVGLRYFIKMPFLGAEELAPLLAVWAYFLGVGYAVRIREHIGGGMLVMLCPNLKVIKAVRLAGSIICLLSACIFIYYTTQNMMFNYQIGKLSTYMRWPKWLWDCSVMVGFALSIFYFAIQCFLEFCDLNGKGRPESTPHGQGKESM